MDPTFQVPMQHCSFQHGTLLPSPVIPTTGCCFCFVSVSSFLSGVISPLFSSGIWGTYWPGEFIFQCPIFLSFHTVYRVLKAGILKWFVIPSPVDHVLSELSTMTHLSWVALHRKVHSCIMLDKAVVHVISLINFLWLVFILYALWWIRIRGLWKLPDGRDWPISGGNWVLF